MCGMQSKAGGITGATAAGCLGDTCTSLPPVTPTQRPRQCSSPGTLTNQGPLPSEGSTKAKVSAPSEGLAGNWVHLLFAAPDEVSKAGPNWLFSPRKTRCKCYGKTSRNGDCRQSLYQHKG